MALYLPWRSRRETGWPETPPDFYGLDDGARHNRSARPNRSGRGFVARGDQRSIRPDSDIRVRIARRVMSEEVDFKAELSAWIPYVQSGGAYRKPYGSLGVTLYDTAQQPVRCPGAINTDRILRDMPQLTRPTPRLRVRGLDIFGGKDRPFIGLVFEPGPLHDEISRLRWAVSPDLTVLDNRRKQHQPHLTLGQIRSENQPMERAQIICEALRETLPQYVQLAPATVEVTDSTST